MSITPLRNSMPSPELTQAVEPTPAPLAVSAKQLAAMLGVSLRTIRAMDTGGKLPRPIRLGRCVRWNLTELQRWIDAGAPPRIQWEAMKKGGRP